MAEIQQAVGALPHGPGFGYARSYDDSTLHAEWIDVLLADLERSRRRIQAVGAIDPACVDQVTEVVEQRRASLGENQPVAFLHDATTKNVLIHERTLSGIVDVDTICFGDPLLTLALTQMSLLKGRLDTEYVTHWHEALSPGPADEELLTLYTTVFCVNFLGELGQRFNKAVAPTVDPDERRHLLELLAGLLTQLGA